MKIIKIPCIRCLYISVVRILYCTHCTVQVLQRIIISLRIFDMLNLYFLSLFSQKRMLIIRIISERMCTRTHREKHEMIFRASWRHVMF